MKRTASIFGALILLSQPAYAQLNLNDASAANSKAVLSLSDGIVQQSTSNSAPTDEVTPPAEEDKGIFSFMDFFKPTITTAWELVWYPTEMQKAPWGILPKPLI